MSKKFWIVCTIVLALGFIAVGYLNFVQYQRASDNDRLLNGTITDLRYQLGLDAKSASPSPSVSPSPSTSVAPSPTDTATPTPTPDAVTPAVPTAAPAATATTKIAANFRRTASANGVLISRLPANTVVILQGSVSGSYTAVTYNGTAGYLLTSAL